MEVITHMKNVTHRWQWWCQLMAAKKLWKILIIHQDNDVILNKVFEHVWNNSRVKGNEMPDLGDVLKMSY